MAIPKSVIYDVHIRAEPVEYPASWSGFKERHGTPEHTVQ